METKFKNVEFLITMKIAPVARIWSNLMMTQRFRKRHNKLLNMWEIGLLYSFRGFGVFLKIPVIIIIRLGENNVLHKI